MLKQFKSFQLDVANECIRRDGIRIALPPKPFAVLRYLIENPGRLVTHDELLDALWPDTYVQPQVLRTYMLDLRKVLSDDAGQPQYIQTIPKRGYCFVAPVVEVAASGVSIPTAIAATENVTTIVGRGDELAKLAAHLQALASGSRRVVMVTGEAGIGKTALIEAFCEKMRASGSVTIGRGQCVEGFGLKEEYYPVMEALGQLCSSPNGEEACRVLARVSPAWFSGLKRETKAGNGEASFPDAGLQQRLAGDLCAALEELAAEVPLILIFEDLNFADRATLQMISALARRRAAAKLMLLITYRPHDVSAGHPLKALKQDLAMRKLCAEIALDPLAKTAIRELLQRELKEQTLPTGLTSFVHQRSEGNPLFAIAILEHLISQRLLVQYEEAGVQRWEQRAPFEDMGAGVPAELAQMIELEIARLPAEEQHLLEAGSLVSTAFPAWAVAAALEQDAGEVEEACDALAGKVYFVERGGQDELPDGAHSAFYVFAHGLYREVLYTRQSPACRAKRHLRIANRLEMLFKGRQANVAREVAYHYEAAGDWHLAVNALRASAQQAFQRQAYAEASDLLEHTLHIAENLGDALHDTVIGELRAELLTARESLTIKSIACWEA